MTDPDSKIEPSNSSKPFQFMAHKGKNALGTIFFCCHPQLLNHCLKEGIRFLIAPKAALVRKLDVAGRHADVGIHL